MPNKIELLKGMLFTLAALSIVEDNCNHPKHKKQVKRYHDKLFFLFKAIVLYEDTKKGGSK